MIKAKKITLTIQVEVPVESYVTDRIQDRLDRNFNPFKSDIEYLDLYLKGIDDMYTEKFQHLTDVCNNMDWMDPSVGHLDFDISLNIEEIEDVKEEA